MIYVCICRCVYIYIHIYLYYALNLFLVYTEGPHAGEIYIVDEDGQLTNKSADIKLDSNGYFDIAGKKIDATDGLLCLLICIH